MQKRDPFLVSAVRVVDGKRQQGRPEEMPNMAVFRSGRERGTLFVLVEAEGPDRAGMEKMLATTIVDSYRRSTGSVTAGLRDALREANANLYAENALVMRGKQTRAGAYCALVRGDDLLLIYAGPAVALLLGQDGVTHLPSALDPTSSPDEHAPGSGWLGLSRDIDPYLYRTECGPGEILVLASPSILDLDTDEALFNAIREEGADGLAGLAGPRPLSALLISYEPAGAAQPTARPAHRRDITRGAGPEEEEEPDSFGGAPASRAQELVAETARKLSALLQSRVHPAQPTREPTVAAAPPSVPPLVKETVEEETAAEQPTEAVAIPDWLDQEEAGPSRPRVGLPGLPSIPRGALLLGALAAIVLIAFGSIWWQGRVRAQQRQEQYQSLMAQAENKRSLGQASFDRTQAVVYLKEAESLVNQALAVKPDDSAALALRDNIRLDMDEARGVVRLQPSQVNVLYTFGAPGTGLARVVGDGANLFVLDKGDQKVYAFQLDAAGTAIRSGSEPVLLRKGDQIGGTVIGDLIDIAWIPAGGNRRAALVILESGGNLVEYEPGKALRVLPVRDATQWRKAQAIGGYNGNFYVMDTLANSILRYLPAARGYDGKPTEYLRDKVELVNGTDMAIDGDIFVLQINGQILWLSGGKPQTFSIAGLDRPMSAPVALFTNTGTDSLYVADPANSRVVQLSKQGVMQRQLVYEDSEGILQRLRGLFVDQQKQALYVTAGTKLLRIALPAQ